MKRYLLFAGQSYYANGGILDLVTTSDSFDDCMNALTPEQASDDDNTEWWHIYDAELNRLAAFKKGCYCGMSYGMAEEVFERLRGVAQPVALTADEHAVLRAAVRDSAELVAHGRVAQPVGSALTDVLDAFERDHDSFHLDHNHIQEWINKLRAALQSAAHPEGR